MKRTTLIFFVLFSVFINAQTSYSNSGISIYKIKSYTNNLNDSIDVSYNYYIDGNKVELENEPLLTEEDILNFNWETQRIELTDSAKTRMKRLYIPVAGLSVAMVLNDEIIYGFWFWNVFSSYWCDWVYTYPTIDFEIKFDFPKYRKNISDPRFDKKLEDYILNRFKHK